MPKLSPIRMFANSPMKTAQSSGAPDLVENEAPGRVPLCPIQETSGLDSSTPRGTRGKKAQAFNPLSENANDSGNSTPEKRALAACNPRSKFGWYQHQAKVDCAHDELGSSSNKQMEHNTPSRIVRPVELGHHSVQLVNKHGGASQYSTPRASKIDNKHFQMYSEPGSNSGKACNSTPKKSVSRSLKYNQELGSLMRVGGPQGTVVKSIGFSQARGVTQALDNSLPAHFELEEDLSFWQDHNVQVLIRVRPLSFTEISLQGQGRCLRQDTAHSLTWTGPPESRFTFDHVACETITQDKLFRVAGLPMVENCISGYNNCMFAYGQTGSGKTHTMLGDIADIDQKQSEDRGMIPRVFEYLFVRIQLEEEARKQEHLKFACKCSFLEIYNEQITDLLEPSSTNLQMREDAKKGVYVEDLTEVEVNSVQDVIKLLLQGSANRKVAATNMNRESSRSHSVFTCVIESKWECDSVINTRFGRLNLVDLAGSERQKSSGAEGDRLKEAANINKSLSTLGLVIMVLVDAANGKPRHVPYRDSKLTFLLQDSLGGNSKTTIMATISPSNSCSMETLSTLKFAQRAKFIRNNAVVNEDTYGDVIALRQQIQQLKEELNHLRSQNLGKQEAPENQGMDTNILGRLGQDILAGSLRREAAAESLAKNLTVEIDHLNRLVRQREEDAQCVKLVLRFREDKIRRMEGVTTGLIDADAYLLEENDAVMEEVKLLRTRIDHNPEVTRFAMENIRLMDELKRLEDFYDHGEREMMSSEISNLRDQLVEFLDATASHKEECRVPNHSMLLQEVEQLRSEACQYQKTVEDYENKLLYFQDQNEKLVRQNEELQEESKNLLKENHGFKRELEQSMVKIHHVEIDQEAHMNTISGLKTLLQECEENKEVEVLKCSELELQLKEALKDIQELQSNFKEAKEVQEQMEEQQLFLINELESVLQQQQNAENDSSKAILKEQLQFLQLELQKRDELRCLEREFATTITAENNNEAEKLKLEAKFQKTREELEEARELNMIFLGETARKAAIEKQMDVTRAEVEVETADTIASMHSELLTTKEKFVAANEHERVAIEHATRLTEELRNLQLENSRLTTLCDSLVKDKDLEAQELRNEWQHATNKLIDYLSEGDQALITAAKEMEDILQLSAPSSLSSHLATRIAEKQGAIEVLKLKLQEAFVIARDAQGKIRALNETTCALTELQKQQKDEMDQEVQKIRFSAAEAASRAHELEFRLRISQDNLTRTEKTAEVAFVVIKYLRESQIELGAGMDATSQRLLEKEACIKLLKCRHGRDLHMIRSLESNLAVAEERANASFIVVKHCTDVQAQLSANIDDASKLLSEKENAFAMLQQKSKAETKLLMETEMKLQAVCEELTQHEERNVDSGTKLCEYSAIISQLRESEKLWNIEKEKMLLELNSLRLESIVMRGALEDSESALRKAVVKVRDCHKEENETAAAVIDAEKQMRKTMLFFEKNLEAIMVSTIADMNKEFADLRIIHADHLDLSSDLEELRTEMVAAKQESQQYEIKFKNAESESACLAEALKVAELHSSSLMSELLTVQTSLAELTSESAEKGAAAKQQIQELKKFLEARSSEICSLQDRISNLEASSEVLISSQSEVAEMIEGEWHSAMRSVEDDLHGLVSLACYLGSNIKDELAELKFGSRDIFICCEELKAENEALKLEQEKTLQGFQSEIECIKAESNCVREAFQAAEAERLSLQKAVKDGEEKLSLSECKILELSSELERSQEKCEVVEKDCMAAVAEMNDLDLKIQELDDHIIHLEEENGVMKKESENQQAVIQSLEQELAKAHEYAEESITAKVSSLQEEIGRKEDLLKGLQFDMSLLQESFAEAREKKKEAEEANAHLEQELYIRTNDIQHMETILSNVRGELSCSTNSLSVMETELQTLKHMTTSLSTESTMLKENIEKLELGRIDLEGELEDRRNVIESLDLELLELSSLVEQKISESLKDLNQELNLVVRERDQLHADLLVVTEQLEMAQAVADEREVLAAEARQVAEVSKAHAEEKEREMKVLESSVGELESTINALENQVGIIKREAQMQRLLREDLEMEIQTLRHEISMGNALTVDGPSPEGGMILHFKEEIAKLNEDCVERDAQIQAYKKHITDLMTASTRQAAQHQQKIAELESVLDQARLTKVKGSSSPFKCLGLSQQMNSEIDEDLSAARRRIGELEAVAAARQTEVFILNARLAEAESMTHDVVRDLLGVKVDISNYASQLNQQHAHQNSERPSTKNDEVEVNGLRKQLQDFIAERESWLEDISRRQAEMVAARVASENLRSRDQALTAEIEILKEENTAYKKQHSELENEIRKLSGQQNLQQRIHHHAKIKEENNGLKMKNEELSTKLRRIETRFNRVNDELVRYRTANGKPQHPNFDEEEQLRNKLKEAEDDNLQMAQKLTTMCASIIQAVGNSCSESDIDPCVALESLQKLQNRLLENEQEIEDLKLKSKVAGEKRRLSELKAQASPSR